MQQTLVISLMCLFFHSPGQKPGLEGHWRRLNKSIEHTSKAPAAIYGDYIFYQDSTFIIVGDSTTKDSTVPGWHSGEELTGNWSLEKNTLWFKNDKGQLILVSRVISVSDKILVLKFGGSAGPGIKYIRL